MRRNHTVFAILIIAMLMLSGCNAFSGMFGGGSTLPSQAEQEQPVDQNQVAQDTIEIVPSVSEDIAVNSDLPMNDSFQSEYGWIIVQAGQTYYSLSQMNGCNLVDADTGAPPQNIDLIYEGQKLRCP